jgi:hypothetical protein
MGSFFDDIFICYATVTSPRLTPSGDAYFMNAEKYVQVILAILLAAGVIFGIRFCNKRATREKERQRQEVVDTMGDADIVPKSSFGEIKKALRVEPELRMFGENAVTADFGDGLVTLIFYEPSNKVDSVTDDDIPVRIGLQTPFKGSICGVRVDDTLEQAVSSLGRCSKAVQPGSETNGIWSIKVGEDYTLSKHKFNYQDQSSNSLYFIDHRYQTTIRNLSTYN